MLRLPSTLHRTGRSFFSSTSYTTWRNRNETIPCMTSNEYKLMILGRQQMRYASNTALDKGVVPGLPYTQQQNTFSLEEFLPMNLPDLSQPEPEPPVEIPYAPDFWNSSASRQVAVEEQVPKILVVAGAETHHGGGPSHNLYNAHVGFDVESTSATPAETVEKSEKKVQPESGLLDDIVEDLGLPPAKEIKSAFRKLFL